jgi:hypothetical protein
MCRLVPLGSLAGVPARRCAGRGSNSRPPYASQVVDLRQTPAEEQGGGTSSEAHCDPTKTHTKALHAIAEPPFSCPTGQGQYSLTVLGH